MLKYILSTVITLILLLVIGNYLKKIGLVYEGMTDRKVMLRNEASDEAGRVCGEPGKVGSGESGDAEEISKMWRNASVKDSCKCAEACRADEKCNSWEWFEQDGKPKCLFKSGYMLEDADPKHRGGVIRVPVNENDPMISYRNKYFSWDKDKVISTHKDANAQSCAAMCAENAQCSAWAKCKVGEDCEGCYLLKDTFVPPQEGKGDEQYAGSKADQFRGKYYNWDTISGGKPKNMGDLNPMECALACDKEPECKYWQRLDKTGESCWLIKDDVEPTDGWDVTYFAGKKNLAAMVPVEEKTPEVPMEMPEMPEVNIDETEETN